MKLTLDQALQKAVEAHKAGNIHEADRYYTAILKASPKHPDANYKMGLLAVDVGKLEASLSFFRMALEVKSNKDEFWISYIEALIKLNRIDEANDTLEKAKNAGAKIKNFEKLKDKINVSASEDIDRKVTKLQINWLKNLLIEKEFQRVLSESKKLLSRYKNQESIYNIMGIAYGSLNRAEEAEKFYRKAIEIEPNFFKPYSNLSLALKDQGKLEEAIEVANKALKLQPSSAEVYNNLGILFQELGEPGKAIEAFKKALIIKPNYAAAYDNMGSALRDQGQFKQAEAAYCKAILIRPDFAEAFRNLTTIKNYSAQDPQFVDAKKQYERSDLSNSARCSLSFALAKMYEDIGRLDKAYDLLFAGNALRKKLLNYSIEDDRRDFKLVKKTQPVLLNIPFKYTETTLKPIPVFIIGMPRSGTTLVEQIISSHSKIKGAGELPYLSRYGSKLAKGLQVPTKNNISEFKQKYLCEVMKRATDENYVTDKTPNNFLFVPLICATFPESKIIHVTRDSRATCWSNFKQYFASNELGYSYNLEDLVNYYFLYVDLMKHWQSHYSGKIYNLDYETLTHEQESETRKLIKYLQLDWENSCLFPEENKRSIKTASQQQVRQKVYQGSSKAWLKYKKYLNGAFDGL